jgi:hypothetical protein
MKTIQAQKIEKILKGCPPDCKCHGRGVENLCKAKDIGLDTFVECMEAKPFECTYAISYGRTSYCSCPVRVEIAQKYEKTG